LSNFLFTHISNRLKNFKRDNYYRLDIGSAQQIQDRKKHLLEPIGIDNIYAVSSKEDAPNNIHITEILKYIDEKLPAKYRRDYLKLKTNSPLPKSRKAIILNIIKEILNEGEDNEKG
jgi:hypothetical protein